MVAERIFFCFTFDARRALYVYLALYVLLDFFFVNYNRWQSVASVTLVFKKKLFRSLSLF